MAFARLCQRSFRTVWFSLLPAAEPLRVLFSRVDTPLLCCREAAFIRWVLELFGNRDLITTGAKASKFVR